MLFPEDFRFSGLPPGPFKVFAIQGRDRRRKRILAQFHPSLDLLGLDLLERLATPEHPLHAHLPRLDWPANYQPFCTWLALSPESAGYQAKAQLNLGVHADYVTPRLGWDASQPGFGRFEFRARHGGIGAALAQAAQELRLRFRVYAAASWPEGSRCVFDSAGDWRRALDEVNRRGVWFEVGRRYELPRDNATITSDTLARETHAIFRGLLPLARRIWG